MFNLYIRQPNNGQSSWILVESFGTLEDAKVEAEIAEYRGWQVKVVAVQSLEAVLH